MAEKSVKRSNPLLSFLGPRSMRVVFIGILLPFILLPLILGWLGYSSARNSLFQSAASDLVVSFEGVDAKSRIWQSDGYERVQAIARDANIVQAASQLESTEASKSAFFNAIYRLQAKGVIFSDLLVLDAATSAVVASTNPTWEGQALAGTSVIKGNPDFSLPFSYLQVNHAIFSPSTFAVLVGAPLQTSSRQTGRVLIGVLQTPDLYQVLSVPLNRSLVDFIVLTFTDDSFVRVNMEEGTFTLLKYISADEKDNIPLTAPASSEYSNIVGKPVVGHTGNLAIYDLVGDNPPVLSKTKILVEKDQSTVFTALAPLTSVMIFLGIALLAALALSVPQAVFFVIRPAARMASAVSRMASGHTDEQVPGTGTSEFVSLAASLNRLTGSLRDVTTLVGTDGQSSTRKIVLSAELIQALSGVVTLEETLRMVINLIRDRLGYDFSSIYLVDDAGQFAVIREASGPAGEKLKAAGNRFPLGSYSIIGSVAQSGKAHQAPNVTEDPMYVRNDLLPDTRSEAALPIRVNRRSIGVLDIHSNEANRFTAEDMDLLQSIADQTGSAIQNVQTVETARVGTEVSQQLFRIGRLVAGATTTEEISKAVIDGMKGTPYVVTILQSETSTMRVTGFYDPVNPEAVEAPVKEINEEPETFARLIPTASPLVVKMEAGMVRIPSNIRQYLDTLGCRVAAFLPLRLGDRLTGVLLLASRDENALTLVTVRPLTPIAESIQSSFERLDLLATTQSRLSELATLNRISQSISQAIDLQGLFETVHEQTRNALGDVDIIITLYDSSRDLLSFPYAFIHGETVTLDTIAMGDSLYSLVIRNAQPLMLDEKVEERAAALGVHLPGIIPQSLVDKQLSTGWWAR
jgi:GAF domain-containing protein